MPLYASTSALLFPRVARGRQTDGALNVAVVTTTTMPQVAWLHIFGNNLSGTPLLNEYTAPPQFVLQSMDITQDSTNAGLAIVESGGPGPGTSNTALFYGSSPSMPLPLTGPSQEMRLATDSERKDYLAYLDTDADAGDALSSRWPERASRTHAGRPGAALSGLSGAMGLGFDVNDNGVALGAFVAGGVLQIVAGPPAGPPASRATKLPTIGGPRTPIGVGAGLGMHLVGYTTEGPAGAVATVVAMTAAGEASSPLAIASGYFPQVAYASLSAQFPERRLRDQLPRSRRGRLRRVLDLFRRRDLRPPMTSRRVGFTTRSYSARNQRCVRPNAATPT